MAIHKFTFEDIGKLDHGVLKIALEQAIADVIKDCVDRPMIGKARSLSLNLQIKPITSQNDIEEVDISFAIKRKIPDRTTRGYRMKPRANGDLVFNDMDPSSPLQHTIDELEEGND